MSSTSSSIEQLRASGNKKYSEKRYKEAISIYKQAIELSKDDATFPSNMSACCFELGDYEEAIKLSKKVIEMINVQGGGDDPKQLTKKNLARIARIVHLKKSKQELEQLVNQFTDNDLQDKTFDFEKIKKSLDSLDQEDWTKKNGSGHVNASTLPIILPARLSDAGEYYIVGHDVAKSALSPHLDGNKVNPGKDNPLTTPRLKEIETERIRLRDHLSLSFFYGGVGDCRHPFITLADLNRRLAGDGSPVPPNIKIHFTLNDIVSSAIARDVLFFTLLEDIGRCKSIEKVYDEREAANAAVILYYTYLGHGMPKAVHAMLIARLEKLISLGDSGQLPKWMSIDMAANWPGIKDAFEYWISDKPELTWSEVKKKAVSEGGLSCDQESSNNGGINTNQTQILEGIRKNLNDPQFLKQFGVNPNDEAKKQEIMKNLMASFSNNDALQQDQNSNLRLSRELGWLRSFGYPLLPTVNADYDKHMTPAKANQCLDGLLAKKNNNNNDKTDLLKTFGKDDMIKVNPTLFDVVYSRKSNHGDTISDFGHKPLDVVADFYQYVWMGEPKQRNKTSSFDYFIHAFYQTARGLVRLSSSNALTIEMCVGDFQSVLDNVRHNKEERKASGMAVEYDGIYLSNVPDYTGYLGLFADTIEMLKPVKHSYIGCNILLQHYIVEIIR
ncbi:hypothetical protein DFA_00641 [Cavenderia fasciculata]|uniref:DUF4470 domain-containing protein n=1 Tax=Cavenderia fasciculata TaxID=261658 RepID=F4PSY7_CACFS|nr:uncharacterized protein DFA_00641 [Cavenderia fasciculata]EGG20776.1 hypothetical protein DFA_00641 [Cavenderia fasciculata]|eukprot:XP_004358626.1 hypothetical protein DFA_00641 [Cavenderia fasciculata]